MNAINAYEANEEARRNAQKASRRNKYGSGRRRRK